MISISFKHCGGTNMNIVISRVLENPYDHQKILEAILARTRIFSFELTKPTLHDIFVRIAGPEAKENHHA